MPDPGQYDQKLGINSHGKYVLSTVPSSKVPSFGRGNRNTYLLSATQVPGPGSYRAISEFGYYEKPLAPNHSFLGKNNSVRSRLFDSIKKVSPKK